MTTYIVSYDLRAPERDYSKLHEHLKSYSESSHPLESVWMVVSTGSAAEVRDMVVKHVDSDDKVLVVTVTSGWATRNISVRLTNWFRSHL